MCIRDSRRILGYMPQQQGLYDSYTGRRFLAYMAALKEIPRKAVAAEVDLSLIHIFHDEQLPVPLHGQDAV